MTDSAPKPIIINNSARCVHFYPNGRRCRLSTTAPNLHFCPGHAPLLANQHHPTPDPAEVASTLTANLDDFTSAAQINNFLSRLLLLLAQDKISTRRAAVLAYITNQLLRTLPAIAKEENAEPAQIIFDAPRPERDFSDPTPPQNTPNLASQEPGTNAPAHA